MIGTAVDPAPRARKKKCAVPEEVSCALALAPADDDESQTGGNYRNVRGARALFRKALSDVSRLIDMTRLENTERPSPH
jgi:hypothetical protein